MRSELLDSLFELARHSKLLGVSTRFARAVGESPAALEEREFELLFAPGSQLM